MLEFLRRKPKKETGMDKAVGRLAEVEARVKGREAEVDPVEDAMANITIDHVDHVDPISAPKVEAPPIVSEPEMKEVTPPVPDQDMANTTIESSNTNLEPEIKEEEAPVSEKSMPSLDKYREEVPVREDASNVVSLDKARAEREDPKVIENIFAEPQEITDTPLAANLNKVPDVKLSVVSGDSLKERIKRYEATKNDTAIDIIEDVVDAVEKEELVQSIVVDTDERVKKLKKQLNEGDITKEEYYKEIRLLQDGAPMVTKTKQFDGVTELKGQGKTLVVEKKELVPSPEDKSVPEKEEEVEILEDTDTIYREKIKRAITNKEERDSVVRILDQEELRRAIEKVPANSPIKKVA